MMLFPAVLACLVLSATAAPSVFNTELDEMWGSYKHHHNKQYSQAEEKFRRLTWEDNVKYIQNHNMEADLGQHSYRLGFNQYADLTNEEYRKQLTGFHPSNATSGASFLAPTNLQAPDEVDWRQHGYVTPVKNQEQCGSCWAFSATGSLEGQHFKKTGTLVSLSEQNLVDCSTREGNKGCHGGNQQVAFKYIIKNGGIDTEESYPYTAKDGVCHYRASDCGATVRSYVEVPRGDEHALQEAVASVGPVSVAMDAGHKSFQLYKTGVYSEPECSPTKLDHGVLVVGYGKHEGDEYWLIKNSWGTSWGLDGYFMMRKNKNNMCGVATDASYPLV